MARKLELYRFRDGVTPLSEAEFNKRFFDIDARLHALEEVKLSWEEAVSTVNAYAVKRIDEILTPTIEDTQNTLEQINTEWETKKVTIDSEWTNKKNTIDNEWATIKSNYDGQMQQIQNDFNTIQTEWANIETEWGNMQSTLDSKADKVVGATAGNFASLDATGNLQDSGKAPSDFALVSSVGDITTLKTYDKSNLVNAVNTFFNAPVFYVDAVNGSDNNDGLTETTAFATLSKAIESIPYGGRGSIIILGDYTLSSSIAIHSKDVSLIPKGVLTFPWFIDGNYAGIYSFFLYNSKVYIFLYGDYNAQIIVQKNTTSVSSIHPHYKAAFLVNEAASYGYININIRTRVDNHNPIVVHDGQLIAISEWSATRPAFLGVSINGHYSGTNRSIKVDSGAYLVNFQNTPGSFYYTYDGGLTRLNGTSISVKDVVAGIVKDTNNIPRNVVSNVIL